MHMQKSQQIQQRYFASGQFDSLRSQSPCDSLNSLPCDEDPGLVSETESINSDIVANKRLGIKPRASALPVIRTPSKTMEKPLGSVFLQYRSETKRATLPNEVTTIDTVRALFVRAFPNQLTMEYLESPRVSVYILDSSRDMFYDLEDLSDIKDRSVLRIQEVEVPEYLQLGSRAPAHKPVLYCQSSQDTDQSYFSEPEYDSDCQRKHVHKIKGAKISNPPYYQMIHPVASEVQVQPNRRFPNFIPAMQIGPSGDIIRSFSPTLEPPVQINQRDQVTQRFTRPYLNASQYLSISGSVSPQASTPSPRPPIPARPVPRAASPMYYNQPSERREFCTAVKTGDSFREHGSPPLARFQQILPVSQIPSSVASSFPLAHHGSSNTATAQQSFTHSENAQSMEVARVRLEQMERQLANLTGLLQSAFTSQGHGGNSVSISQDHEVYHPEEHFSVIKSDKSVSFDKKISYNDESRKSILSNSSRQVSFEGIVDPIEMNSRLRVLQKRTRDLKIDLRSLRKLSVYHTATIKKEFQEFIESVRSVLENINESRFTGKDDILQTESVYNSKVEVLESELSDLEVTVEKVRDNVINKRFRVTTLEVERLATMLSLSSKSVADIKVLFDTNQEVFANALEADIEKVSMEKRFLTDEPTRIDNFIRRCKKLTGTLLTLKRLATVQEQRQFNCPDGQESDSGPQPTPKAVLKGDASTRSGKGRQHWKSETDARTRAQNTLDDLLNQLKNISTDTEITPCSSPKLPQKGNIRNPPPHPPRRPRFQPDRTSSPTNKLVMTGIRVLPSAASPVAREQLSSTSSSTESIDSQNGVLISRRLSMKDHDNKKREPEIYDFGKEAIATTKPISKVEPNSVKKIEEKTWAETDII
ncbi:coiled-coil domain-containing protein CG32809-like isoform X3 [Artemia franciscana]|uniref:coiled-coil domain-containing protein CG32809-like isoform X3 n=1 Tax=Artemia franciscana TaxID=6661 RepID=UPI0032DB4AD9